MTSETKTYNFSKVYKHISEISGYHYLISTLCDPEGVENIILEVISDALDKIGCAALFYRFALGTYPERKLFDWIVSLLSRSLQPVEIYFCTRIPDKAN